MNVVSGGDLLGAAALQQGLLIYKTVKGRIVSGVDLLGAGIINL